MERNHIRALYLRARDGEAIPGENVVALCNYLAETEFEVDCQTLTVQSAKEVAEAFRVRAEKAEAAGAVLLRHIYESGIAYDNTEVEAALAVFASQERRHR